MKLIVKATNLELTSALRIYLEKKIKSLEKFFVKTADEEAVARIEVARTTRHHKRGDVYRVDINLELPGRIFRAEHTEADVRAAIDLVRDKLKREIARYKAKQAK
jgi:putative sigma-54 modulation protein